jgi:DNA-binding GntR family transcriptional regulator
MDKKDTHLRSAMDKKNAVYEDIRRQIAERQLHPGHWLLERELCETYQMSRTPVREILRKLAADGFLEQDSHRGFVVRQLGLEQVFEIFQAREAIEGMAARLACRLAGEEFHVKLRDIKKRISTSDIASDPEQGHRLGRELHQAIMIAARNSIMSEINERLKNLTLLTTNIAKRAPMIEKASAAAHSRIINALLKRDENKAENLMREHLRETCRYVVEQFYPGMLESASSRTK